MLNSKKIFYLIIKKKNYLYTILNNLYNLFNLCIEVCSKNLFR